MRIKGAEGTDCITQGGWCWGQGRVLLWQSGQGKSSWVSVEIRGTRRASHLKSGDWNEQNPVSLSDKFLKRKRIGDYQEGLKGQPAWEGAGEVGGLVSTGHEKESGFSPNCRKTFEGLQAERQCEANLHLEKVGMEHHVENGLSSGDKQTAAAVPLGQPALCQGEAGR